MVAQLSRQREYTHLKEGLRTAGERRYRTQGIEQAPIETRCEQVDRSQPATNQRIHHLQTERPLEPQDLGLTGQGYGHHTLATQSELENEGEPQKL